MKRKITLLFLLSITFGFAQIPAGYYSTATGSGYTLKTQLYNIINNNTNSSTNQDYGDLWTLYTQPAFRDTYYDNDNSLLDIYSEILTAQETFGNYPYTSTSEQCGSYSGEGSCYNREHVLPQSVFSSNYPMQSDAHFVLPSDGYVNGQRSDLPFGVVNSATWTSTNGSKRGSNLNSGYSAGYTGTVFEPIDEFKGDIARALLYFGTRYENQISGWSYVMFNSGTGVNQPVYTSTFLNILLTWHLNDPVSAYEIAKNNAVYTFQGNRNPYIDHPEYVCQVYVTQCAPLSTNDFTTLNNISIYPNPTSNGAFSISSTEQLKSITVYNVNGQIIQEIKNPNTVTTETYNVNNLSTGFYLVQLASENGSVTKKVIVN